MFTEPASNRIAITADDIDHPIRDTGFRQKLAQPKSGSGGQLARFNHAGATGREREREFLANDQEREIPGGDHADNPDWFADHQAEHRCSQRIISVSMNVPAEGGGVIPEARCPIHFIPGLGDRFAAFQGLDQGQLFFLLANKFRRFQKTFHAIGPGRMRPGSAIEGLAGHRNCRVDIGDIRFRVISNDHAMRRAPALKSFARSGRNFLAVDPQLVVKRCFRNHEFQCPVN